MSEYCDKLRHIVTCLAAFRLSMHIVIGVLAAGNKKMMGGVGVGRGGA